jgi:hypothetical protein
MEPEILLSAAILEMCKQKNRIHDFGIYYFDVLILKNRAMYISDLTIDAEKDILDKCGLVDYLLTSRNIVHSLL